jgi:hypothetical protein
MKKTKIFFAFFIFAMLGGAWFFNHAFNETARNNFSQNETDEKFFLTLSVRVDALLYDMDLLHGEKRELIPEDGIIFPATKINFQSGESVFDVLQREMRGAGIHMAFRRPPVIDSVYVEAINNIYEFDAGALSGWVYRVNGELPDMSASMYFLQPDDEVEWLYSIDLGRDI